MQRRFIAGAVCPRCSAMDKVVMYDDSDGRRVRECVACGFRDALNEHGQPAELPTRVNQPRPGEAALPHEEEVQVVRLFETPDTPRRDN